MTKFWKRLTLALALGSVSPAAHGSTLNWDSAGPSDNWNLVDLNWDGGSVAWTDGNDADFSGTGEAVTVNADVSAITVTVNSTGFTFGGANALTLTSGIIANESTSFANPLTLSGAQTWTVAAGKTLGVSGTATADNTISVSGGGTLAISGSGGKFASNTGISIGTNTTFALDAGFNEIFFSGSATNFTILAGGALAANAASNNAHNVGALNLQGGSVTSANANHGGFGNFVLADDGDNITHTGNTQSVISASRIDIGSGGNGIRTFSVADGTAATDLAVSSELMGTRALTKTGAGKMEVTGNSSLTGDVNVNGGTLTTGTGNGVQYLGNRTLTRAITVNSGAVLELLGTYQLATGGSVIPGSSITIDGGTLQNNSTVSGQFDVLNNLTMRNGATLTANSSSYGGNYQAFQLRGDVTVANTGGNTTASTIAGGTGSNRSLHLFTSTEFDVADVTGTSAVDLTVSTELANPNGDLGGSGSLQKSGAGTMRLTATNAYGGSTTITAGTLLVSNASGTGVGTGDVSIDGGTLGGVGFVGAGSDASNVSFTANGGTIAPGESPGVLTVFGDVDFNTGSGTKTFSVELNGLTVGTQYDQLVVNTATGGTDLINLTGGTLAVSLGFTPALNDTFTIINNATAAAVTGNFNGLLNNSTFLAGATTFRINYDLGTGNDVVLTVVPEPGTSAMLLLGSVMMWIVGRKRS